MSTVVKCGEHLLPVRENGLCVSCMADSAIGEPRRLRQPCPHGSADTLLRPCPACSAHRASRAPAGLAHVLAAINAARTVPEESE